MKDKVKLLLGIHDTGRDELIDLVLEILTEQVKNYCNLDSLPAGLPGVLCLMAADLITGLEGHAGTEKTVSRGDTSVSFFTPDELGRDSAACLKRYRSQLDRFRRLQWEK